MKRIRISAVIFGLATLFVFPFTVRAQESRPVGERPEVSTRRTQPADAESPATRGVPAQTNQAAAPRLVKVSGVLTEFVRNPASSSVEMTFAVYKDEVGGEALWTETQSVEVDKEGRYTALLGAAQADGVPLELFPAGEPRWLGVEIRGQAPQSRTLLVSVPYALKALDAEKLSGKSLSDFVLSESLGEQVRQVIQTQGQAAGQSTLAGAQQKQTGTSSTTTPQTSSPGPKFPPSTFSGTTSDQIVLVQQNGSGNGLYAQTASSSGSSVFGVADATTGNASGVIGVTNGGGAGVIGVTNAASCCTNGVYGKSINGNGVQGDATASSGYAVGVNGQTASTSGDGVSGIAHALTGFTTGVFGDSLSTDGVGVAGFEDATSGYTKGVYGQSASTSGDGVIGNATATSGFANGVYGQTSSSDAAGVSGFALATSGFTAGVVGQSDSTSGSGVAGYERATSGATAGVIGQVFSPNGIAGVFSNVPGQGLLLQGLSGPNFDQVFSVDAFGNLEISGNLTVHGAKSSTAKLHNGRQVVLYAVESPENWFEDFGSAELKGGVAWVPLDASFAEATNAAVTYHVFLTPNGDSNGLYVARKTAAGFEVREHAGGGSNVAFDYRIVVKRRGFESVRMADVQHDVKTADASRQHLAQFVTAGMPNKAATIKPPRNIQAPTARPNVPEVPRPIVPQAPKVNVPQAPKGNVPPPRQP